MDNLLNDADNFDTLGCFPFGFRPPVNLDNDLEVSVPRIVLVGDREELLDWRLDGRS